jgi:hypothetical protein
MVDSVKLVLVVQRGWLAARRRDAQSAVLDAQAELEYEDQLRRYEYEAREHEYDDTRDIDDALER